MPTPELPELVLGGSGRRRRGAERGPEQLWMREGEERLHSEPAGQVRLEVKSAYSGSLAGARGQGLHSSGPE